MRVQHAREFVEIRHAHCGTATVKSACSDPPASCCSRFRLAPDFGGRKPRKRKSSAGSPEATSAASAAEAPGSGMTRCPAAIAALMMRLPGSLMAGVPASNRRPSFCQTPEWKPEPMSAAGLRRCIPTCIRDECQRCPHLKLLEHLRRRMQSPVELSQNQAGLH